MLLLTVAILGAREDGDAQQRISALEALLMERRGWSATRCQLKGPLRGRQRRLRCRGAAKLM